MTYCGINPGNLLNSINYMLELAEGQPYRSSTSSRFVSELSAENYQMMCRGPNVTQAQVNDLKPSTWYYWRVSIEYAGGNTRVQSCSKIVPTLRSVPSVPSKPRVHILPGTKSFTAQDSLPDSRVMVTWLPSACNGSTIERYQLQLREIEYAAATPSPGTTRLRPATTQDIMRTLHFNRSVSKWHSVYANLKSETVLQAPRPGVMEWGFRVRAKNADGWSDFSTVRTINKYSHPSLFQEAESPGPAPAAVPGEEKDPQHRSPKTPSSSTPSARAGPSQGSEVEPPGPGEILYINRERERPALPGRARPAPLRVRAQRTGSAPR